MGRTGSGVEIRPNSIRVKFVHDGITHRPTLMMEGQPMAPTPANVKYAHRLGHEIRTKIDAGTFVLAEYFPAYGKATTGAPISVATQLDGWLDAQRLQPSTMTSYTSVVRFWKEAPCDKAGTKLGDLPLRTLRKSHILTALALRPELTGKTLNNRVSVLRSALALAVDDKLIPESPAETIPKASHQTPPPDPFTREEADRIIADMASRYPEPVYNLMEFWFYSGLRTGELIGLRWDNVDLASGTILVSEGIVQRQAKASTKTGVARTVRLNSVALAALQRQRKHTQMRQQAPTGGRQQLVEGLVFLRPQERTTGRPGPSPSRSDWSNENAFATFWKPTLTRLGIRYRRPYNARHTYATMMLMAGRTPAWCAKQLGHSVRMFLEVYSKWIEGDADDREVAGLERWFAARA